MLQPGEIAVDNFAGGGGASNGMARALGRDPDIALNHDADACAMYAANHPRTKIYCQSVYKADPRDVVAGPDGRPRRVGIGWFSPDCTDHSKAKGSAPIRNRASRDLAWVIVHWAKLTKLRMIFMENVEEWLGWGPLRQRRWPDGRLMEDLHGNPVLERDPDRAGQTFRKWLKALRRLGYAVEYRLLRASDLGAPTIRKRLYLIARNDGVPIVWPGATHGPGLTPFRTAAECIDWSLPCPSIFDRKKALVDNSMARIGRGVWRYVVGCADPFIVPVTHQGDERVYGIHEPLRTITTAKRGEMALIVPTIARVFGKSTGSAIDDPLGTVTAGGGGKTALVAAFLAQHNGGPKNDKYGGLPGRRADKPISSVTTRGTQQQLVVSHLVKIRNNCTGQDVREPLHTITGGRRGGAAGHFAEVRAFLIKYYGTAVGQRLGEPLHTVTSDDRFALVTIHGVDYAIVDIGMRMLTARELFNAQGFDPDYIIDRGPDGKRLTKTAQVRMCGNSVCPPVAHALIAANLTMPVPEMKAA